MKRSIFLLAAVLCILYLAVSGCVSIKPPEGSTHHLQYVQFIPKVNKKSLKQLAIELDYPFLLSIENNIFILPEACLPERALNGTWQGRNLAGGRDNRNLGGGDGGRRLGGSDDGRNLGGADDGRNLAGADDGRNLAGADDGRNLGGADDGRNLGGADDGRNLAGADDGRNLGGADDGRNLGGADDGRNLGGADDGRNLGGADDGRNLAGGFSDCKCMYYKGKNSVDILGINRKSKIRFFNGSYFTKIKKGRIKMKYF